MAETKHAKNRSHQEYSQDEASDEKEETEDDGSFQRASKEVKAEPADTSNEDQTVFEGNDGLTRAEHEQI